MTGTDLVPLEQKWADLAKQAAEQAPVSSGQTLSAKGGVFKLGEQVLGTQLCVVVIDSVWLNTYFTGKWDANNPVPPKCYAYGRAYDEMAPHPSMQADMTYFAPQNGVEYAEDGVTVRPRPCATCPMNEWGSGNEGRGKACQNREKLAIIPAGWFTQRPRSYDYDLQLADDPKHFMSQDMVKFMLPVTSVKGYREYVQNLAATVRRPPFGAYTRMFLEPDAQSQFKVRFEMIETLPDHLAQVVMNRNEAIRDTMDEPYMPPSAQPPRPQQGGFRR